MFFSNVFSCSASRFLPALLKRALFLAAIVMLVGSVPFHAQLTTPEQFFGHEIGADYVLPNYRQLTEYWRILERESDRMTMVDIGETAEGRRQFMAIVTSPGNHGNLEHYREISERLARAEGLSDAEAQRLAQEGKTVVWIDGGLHASEVLGAQQLMETLWQMVSGTDDDNSHSRRRHHPVRSRQPGWARSRSRLVHAFTGAHGPLVSRSSSAVPEVRGAR